MTLLLDSGRLADRRAAAAGPLAPLAASLAADLRVAIARVAPHGDPFIPAEKARMTRRGGRCPREGALLAFDPFEPRRHRCPACAAEYDDEAHYRWWIMWYQLWLAERAAHAAVLHLVTDDPPLAAFAARVLDAWAARYASYPNADNVLGPTRPFFSTYLESIWLLQLAVALDALEAADPDATRPLGARVRERVIAPSRSIIAGYDEGMSNRQVWNGAALLAAGRLLDDAPLVDRALHGPAGLVAQLDRALLADGTWYEGENYHQFAHRGLWYAVTLAEVGGAHVPERLRQRFDAGFAAPFLTALPDLTLPSRRDSQYAISLRQWRYAESCELGLGRVDDPRLAGMLARLYDPAGAARVDTGRWRSAAESERNEPPSSLGRADLGWRSLLHALPTLPDTGGWAPESVLLPAQGIAVFRRDRGRLYAALDYGHSGGPHGHPDRLNVLLADGERRWLDDVGTGSYVERALHWYRSTLAHNAPLVDGRSQARVDGRLLAFEEHADLGWALAEAEIAAGVTTHRALVVGHYVIDELSWRAAREVVLDLPVHVDGVVRLAGDWLPADPGGAGGLEDGFDFLADVHSARAAAGELAALEVGGRPVARIRSDSECTWFRATAPGAPGRGRAGFAFVRVRGTSGRIVSVWDPRGVVRGVSFDGDALRVEHSAGADVHRHTDAGWSITASHDDANRMVVLSGRVAAGAPPEAAAGPPARRAPVMLSRRGVPWITELAEPHYRRSEPTWIEAGRPSARVTVAVAGGALALDVLVRETEPCFVSAGTENELDNERAETNGDGVQLYLRPGAGGARAGAFGWLLVPDPPSTAVHALPVGETAGAPPLAARWRRTREGYAVACEVPLAPLVRGGDAFALDVIVNETAPGRERRRGQLVLSGAAGEFVYLQGDRQRPERLMEVRLTE